MRRRASRSGWINWSSSARSRASAYEDAFWSPSPTVSALAAPGAASIATSATRSACRRASFMSLEFVRVMRGSAASPRPLQTTPGPQCGALPVGARWLSAQRETASIQSNDRPSQRVRARDAGTVATGTGRSLAVSAMRGPNGGCVAVLPRPGSQPLRIAIETT